MRGWSGTDATSTIPRAGGKAVPKGNVRSRESFHPPLGSKTAVSIGLNDVAIEGVYTWVSGEPVLYTKPKPPVKQRLSPLENVSCLIIKDRLRSRNL